MRRSLMVLVALVFTVSVIGLIVGEVDAAKKKVLLPYKMVVESKSAFDSVIDITDNNIYDGLNKQQQGMYSHTFRFDHRDSAKALTFDSIAFYYNILEYDNGAIQYGFQGFRDGDFVIHDDSASIQMAIDIDLGTEINGTWHTLRSLLIQEHGVGTAEVDTIDFAAIKSESLWTINIAQELQGGTDADSSAMFVADKIRLTVVAKDSTQVADTLTDDGYSYNILTRMFVREEY